ncbi:MAG: hypothetical protein ACYTG0_12235 [Planctomycetota bacterium]|jgi:hypothetical protein
MGCSLAATAGVSSSARPDTPGAGFYHLNDCKQEDDALPTIHGLPFEVLNHNRSLGEEKGTSLIILPGARFYHLNDCKQEDDALSTIHGLPFEVLNRIRSLGI